MLVLVTGGARSGKSSFAEQYAAQLGNHVTYIATASVSGDEEMTARIKLHRKQRDRTGINWTTLEEPLYLAEAIQQINESVHPQAKAIVLVDCLTVWLTNVMYLESGETERTQTEIASEIEQLANAANHFAGTLILVTNEVGDGIVPAYVSGRRFRDEAGRMNQRLASMSDEVYLVTAGIPVELTQLRHRF